MEVLKRCSRCGVDRPVSGFSANHNGRFGVQSVCKGCCSVSSKLRVAKRTAIGEERIPARKVCPRCRVEFPASGFSRQRCTIDGLRTYCRECDKIVRRAGKYALTQCRVVEMLQQTRCEACRDQLLTDADKHIDHRHADGAVRGILCDRCNTTIGKCKENPAILMGMCEYLARTRNVDYRKQPYCVTNGGGDGTVIPIDSPTPEAEGTACPTNSPQNPISPPQ